jgi:hypothetical protein
MKHKIFFKVLVADAIVYYDRENFDKYTRVMCEIEISHSVIEVFNEIVEHGRARFFNLKGYVKYDRNFRFYDHSTGSITTHYLYLQFTKNSMCQSYSNLRNFREELADFREFSRERFARNFLLSSVDLEDKSTFAIYQNDMKNYKNEIDVVGIILESDHQKMYGVLKNGHLFKLMVIPELTELIYRSTLSPSFLTLGL